MENKAFEYLSDICGVIPNGLTMATESRVYIVDDRNKNMPHMISGSFTGFSFDTQNGNNDNLNSREGALERLNVQFVADDEKTYSYPMKYVFFDLDSALERMKIICSTLSVVQDVEEVE